VHPSCQPSSHQDTAGPCAVAGQLLGLDGLHPLAAERLPRDSQHPRGLLRLTVQTGPPEVACRTCGVLAADHGRHEHRLADAPCFATPVQLIWRKRRWRCREPRCPTGVWSEEHPALPTRAKLTTWAVTWAIQTLRWDDSTVSALARQLSMDWHTLLDAIRAHAADNLDGASARSARLAGVDTLGVDEHIWRPSARHRDRAVTSSVDLTRDLDGRVHARLFDVTLGRSGPVYATWLRAQPGEFVAGITHAALEPFRCYANAIRTELPGDTVTVLDAFHVVKLASTAMDEVRRRVQQNTLGRRGHRNDPLYRIRRLLTTARENLAERGPRAPGRMWEGFSSKRPRGRTCRTELAGQQEHTIEQSRDQPRWSLSLCPAALTSRALSASVWQSQSRANVAAHSPSRCPSPATSPG
jgi:transposase